MATPRTFKNADGTTSFKITVNFTLDGVKHRETRSFTKKQLAIDWAAKRKTELQHESVHGSQNTATIKSVIERYQKQFAHNYGKTKNYDMARLMTYKIAELPVDKLSVKAIVAHCMDRNKEAKPQTVMNDVMWLRTVLRTMSAIDGFQFDSSVFETAMVVLKNEKLVARTARRDRLPTNIELIKLARFFKRKTRSKIPMFDIIAFAYFSTRRLGEITRIEWTDNNDEKQTGMVRDAKHPRDKKGNHRRFKYDRIAWKIAMRQPKIHSFIFPYNSKTVSNLFDNACKLLGIKDLHFHDLRHAGCSRLFSKGYSIEQVQQFSLHESWASLARYTHIKPEDIKSL